MAALTAMGMSLFSQRKLIELIKYPLVEGGVIPAIRPQYDDVYEREMIRLKSEYFQSLPRTLTGTVTVPTSVSRHNKRLLLCQP